MLFFAGESSTFETDLRADEKFGRDDDGREKSGGGVEQTNPRLLADVCQMSEIPGHEIINFVKRSKGDVQRVSQIFAVKNSARDVAFGLDGDFFGEFERCERRDEF